MAKVTLSSSLEDVIVDYLEYCEISKNLSQNSIKMYHYYLSDFLEWARSFTKNEKIKMLFHDGIR